jgi:hypothetical protein
VPAPGGTDHVYGPKMIYAALRMAALPSSVSADSQAIPIATINAAVLAIFLGGLIAYAVVAMQRKREMTHELLAVARTANELTPSGVFWMGATYREFDDYDPSNTEARDELLSRLKEKVRFPRLSGRVGCGDHAAVAVS